MIEWFFEALRRRYSRRVMLAAHRRYRRSQDAVGRPQRHRTPMDRMVTVVALLQAAEGRKRR